MIQYRARIWKRIHRDSEYKAWMLSTKDGPVTKQVKDDHQDSAIDQAFCTRLLKLPGEIRNQIYDELLMRQCVDTEGDPTPLYRSICVTKRSHAAATYTGQTGLPMNRYEPLAYIGRHHQIWLEIFGKWASSTSFRLTEAFELQSKPISIKDRLLFRRHVSQTLPFTRYLDAEPSRVFDQSVTWFALMRACALHLNIFNVMTPGFRDSSSLDSKLRTCMEEVVRVLKGATNLDNLNIEVFLWPDCYQDSSSNVTWRGHDLPQRCNLWDGLQPLKSIQGIQEIHLHAGARLHEEWTKKNGAIKTHI
jgi:hypothetical protein